jgi:hypothetical protein
LDGIAAHIRYAGLEVRELPTVASDHTQASVACVRKLARDGPRELDVRAIALCECGLRPREREQNAGGSDNAAVLHCDISLGICHY